MGVDTVKLAYDLRPLCDSLDCGWGDTSALADGCSGWNMGKRYGSTGPVHWQEWVNEDNGLRVTVKGVRGRPTMLWEGSLPKLLGVAGVVEPETVRILDRYLRGLVPGIGQPRVRRLDLTHDVLDFNGSVRRAALGWNPHARSRYVQADYQGGQTVWQHNKSRGVRVYDKYEECGESWAMGLTRIEYQMRGDWCGKVGCGHLHSRFGEYARAALEPLVLSLLERVGQEEGGSDAGRVVSAL